MVETLKAMSHQSVTGWYVMGLILIGPVINVILLNLNLTPKRRRWQF